MPIKVAMGKTIQVASDRAFDQTKTVLPAEVARGVYMRNAPSLQALKLMHLMIGTAGGRMAEDVRHEICLSDIRKIDGMNNHTRASLTPLFQELAAAVITHDHPEKMVVTIGGLLDEARIDYRHEVSGDLLVTWWFGRSFRRMAEESNHWAILDRQTVFHLGSKYSVLLFQHIASFEPYQHIKSRTFTVPELRAILGIPEGKLDRFSNLMQKALKPAIDEIGQLSRFVLTVTPRKIGRTVASVEISWAEKETEAKADTKRELDRPKQGRKARRDGSVEMVSAPEAFPDAGSIAYSSWAAIAKEVLPEPRRDLDLVASDFRSFCATRRINLAANNIEKTFRTFCGKVDPAR